MRQNELRLAVKSSQERLKPLREALRGPKTHNHTPGTFRRTLKTPPVHLTTLLGFLNSENLYFQGIRRTTLKAAGSS
jgi:hypothetical protein